MSVEIFIDDRVTAIAIRLLVLEEKVNELIKWKESRCTCEVTMGKRLEELEERVNHLWKFR